MKAWAVFGILALVAINVVVLRGAVRARANRAWPLEASSPLECAPVHELSFHDALGKRHDFADPETTVVIVGIDLSRGREALEKSRILATGRSPAGSAPHRLIIAATGANEEVRALAAVSAIGDAIVADRTQIDAAFQGGSGRLPPAAVFVVNPGACIVPVCSRPKPLELQVFLAQWFRWRWHE